MPTTVHLPPELLERLDERARRSRLSRNQYVRRALERMIESETAWSAAFLDALEAAARDTDGRQAIDEMMCAVTRRSRKQPPRL